jgi:phage minor structural protein
MYIVEIKNGGITRTIQNAKHKLSSGIVVQGINTIDSFSFSILPNNPGFGNLHEFTTLVKVFNEAKNRTEFCGRVLRSIPSMNESGLITEEVTCESFLGFLCDSQQIYRKESVWSAGTFLATVINAHNSQVEDYKKFELQVDDDYSRKSVTCGTARENTWKTIQEKLLNNIGGEIYFDVVDGKNILYVKKKRGFESTTEIALSRNMKSITREKDPSSFITRLIPLGATIKDDEGNDTGERIDITSVNDGKNYIDDEEGIAKYGIHIGYVEFDNAEYAANVFAQGRIWLENNNKVLVKNIVTALDLSLINLDIDDFQVCNYHPLKNKLLGIDDNARIIRKNIDVCNDAKSSFEIGESFKTLSEIQREQMTSLHKINAEVALIKSNYVTNKELKSELQSATSSIINQTSSSILAQVSAGYVTNNNFNTYKSEATAQLELKVGKNDKDQIVSMLNASASEINITANRLSISSDYFALTKKGVITATSGYIGGWAIQNDDLRNNWIDSSGNNHIVRLRKDTLYYQKEVSGVAAQPETASWSNIVAAVNYIIKNQSDITTMTSWVKSNKDSVSTWLTRLNSGVSNSEYEYRTTGTNQKLTFTYGILTSAKNG